MNNKTTFRVNMKTFRWAKERWKGRDVRIDPYLDDHTLMVTKERFMQEKPRRRKVIISEEIYREEMNKWVEQFSMSTYLRKAMNK